MKYPGFSLLILIFLSGCTQNVSENTVTTTITSSSNDFNEVKRVINALYDDNLIIDDERYLELKQELDIFEDQGIDEVEISDLKEKLETLKPRSAETTVIHQYNTLDALENEINEIINGNKLVGPDHYQRMLNDLNNLESQGADKQRIDSLRAKLETLNPANYENSNQQTQQDPDAEIVAMLPECSNQQFTVPTVDLDKFFEITPIGNLGPPGHTLPTDHMYIHISGGRSTTATAPLKSPGEIYILSITSDADDIAPERIEYVIHYALCKDVFGYFNHVKGVSDQIKTWLNNVECEKFTEGPQDSCTKRIFQKVSAGTVIGEVGHLQGNFDFGAYDYRKQLAFANISRYGDPASFSSSLGKPRSLYIVCPLDLYEDSVKTQIYQKVAGSNDPKCGKTMYDVKGTLQGNWFYQNSRSDIGPNSGHLSFVYDNQDPTKAVISIGGTITNPGKLIFTAQISGTMNRRFDQVINDGNIYCFTDGSNKVIVQLTGQVKIKIEHKSGSCSSSETFITPYIYER